MLNREQIKAATIPPAGVMPVPELGGEIGIKALTAQEVSDIRGWNDIDSFDTVVRFAALVICDGAGTRLFSEADQNELKTLPFSTLMQIGEKARDLNFLSEKSREELKKNSLTGG